MVWYYQLVLAHSLLPSLNHQLNVDICSRSQYLMIFIRASKSGHFWLFIFLKTYVHVVYARYVLVRTETRRKHQISKNWSYRPLWITQYRCWELNAGSLEKQHIFLITVKSLQPFRCFPGSLSVHHTSWMVLETGVVCFPIHSLLRSWS